MRPIVCPRGKLNILREAHYYIVLFFCRSDEFRPAYGRLHELLALIPERMPYLACTATATKSIRRAVIKNLDMTGCDFVFTSPDRQNICYEVRHEQI